MTNFNGSAARGDKVKPKTFDFSSLGGEVTGHSPVCTPGATAKIAENDGTLSPILFRYLSLATPSRKEEPMHAIMKQFLPTMQTDVMGNAYVLVGGEKQKTMFSCHIDTVHRKEMPLSLYKTKHPKPQFRDFVFAVEESEKHGESGVESVLGADDRLGMYIMTRMIKEKIPGLYVFHVQEESGGAGSTSFSTTHATSMLKDITHCIAFDRAGYSDVITHQRGKTRFASDECADALASKLNLTLPKFRAFEPCDGGLFTDSANYAHIIPECFNLSVGYFQQHTYQEHFDAYWLDKLLIPSILKVDWESLPVAHKITPKVTYSGSTWTGSSHRWSRGGRSDNIYDIRKEYRQDGLYEDGLHLSEYTTYDKLPDVTPATVFAPTTKASTIRTVLSRSVINGTFTPAALIDAYITSMGSATVASKKIEDLEQQVATLKTTLTAKDITIKRSATLLRRLATELPEDLRDKFFGKKDETVAFIPALDVDDVNTRVNRMTRVSSDFIKVKMDNCDYRKNNPDDFSKLDQLMAFVTDLDADIVEMTTAAKAKDMVVYNKYLADANHKLRRAEVLESALKSYIETGSIKKPDANTGVTIDMTGSTTDGNSQSTETVTVLAPSFGEGVTVH